MWVLVPIKAYDRAKQRLAGLLSLAERSGLAAAMAADVLDVVSTVPQVERVIVCSGNADVAHLAQARSAEFLQDSASACSLAQVVNHAAKRLADEGASDIAVIHGDLPLLSVVELERFFAAHRMADARAVTIAPDHTGSGTNLLAWKPLAAFSTQYGAGSFYRHCENARECGISVTVCELAGAAQDCLVRSNGQIAYGRKDVTASYRVSLDSRDDGLWNLSNNGMQLLYRHTDRSTSIILPIVC